MGIVSLTAKPHRGQVITDSSSIQIPLWGVATQQCTAGERAGFGYFMPVTM